MNGDFLKNVYGHSNIKKELFLIRNRYLNLSQHSDKKKLLPRGILFYGDSGNGKTLLMNEYAKSFNYQIFVLEADSKEPVKEMIDIYKSSRKCGNAIVIIDEIDRLLKKDDRLTQKIYSGLSKDIFNENVLTLATINQLSDLPDALLKDGVFDYKFKLANNDRADLEEAIKGFLSSYGLQLNDDDIYELSDDLLHHPLSEIKRAIEIVTFRNGDKFVVNDIVNAVDFLETGLLYKNRNFKVNKETAIHEAGHVMYLYLFSKSQEFLHSYFRQNGGKTVYRDLLDVETRDSLFNLLRFSLSGIAAEEIICKRHKLGCEDDIKIAHRSAWRLLENNIDKIDYYVSSKLIYDRSAISPYLSNSLDKRIAKIIKKNFRFVKRQLKSHKREIKLISDYLIKHQSINKIQLKALLEREK